jgi:NADH-quinone oxidoreductase subunit N
MKAIILTSILGIVSMLSEIIGLKKFIYPIILVGLLGTIGITISEGFIHQSFYNMIVLDNYAVVFIVVILSIVLGWFLISRECYESNEFNQGDHYALVLFSSVGALLLASYNNMTTLFLGIEILTIPLYILAGSDKKNEFSIESSVKYFILGSVATGILLLGIAFIYGASVSFDLATIQSKLSSLSFNENQNTLFVVGTLLILVAFFFKISVVPFHFWAPDVYTGAPNFITGYMATAVKVAAMVGFYRFLNLTFVNELPNYIVLIIQAIGAITILFGNILAVNQEQFKRMLAFSGVAQAGYVVLLMSLQNNNAQISLLLYVIAYAVASLPLFYIVYRINKDCGSTSFENFKGLAKSQPLLAAVATFSLLSLAGIPPTAGFIGKFYIFTTVLNADQLPLVLIAIIGSLISVYYYFKVIIAMYSNESTVESITLNVPLVHKLILVSLSIVILVVGILPEILIQLGSKL